MKFIFKLINIWLLKVLLGRVHKNAFKFVNVLIVTPHPDDEIFGIGGLILQLLDSGNKVSVLFLTDGENSDNWPNIDEIKHQRILLSEKICTSIGIDAMEIIRFQIPDGKVPHPNQPGFVDTVNSLKVLIEKIKPDAIFTTHIMDYWPFDHIAAAHISMEAVKESACKPELWFYWVWAWYHIKPWQLIKLNPNRLLKIDISDQLKKKSELIDIYLNSFTVDGKPWIGNIPRPLLCAFKFNFEVVEKIKV